MNARVLVTWIVLLWVGVGGFGLVTLPVLLVDWIRGAAMPATAFGIAMLVVMVAALATSALFLRRVWRAPHDWQLFEHRRHWWLMCQLIAGLAGIAVAVGMQAWLYGGR